MSSVGDAGVPFAAGLPQAPVWAVLNPTAKGYHRARYAVERACVDAGLGEARVVTTTREDPGGPQARAAVASGARLVVAGGGDGTVAAVAGALAGTGVELGIVPLGTANLFAHNLGLRTRDPLVAVERALYAPGRGVDVGWASWRPVEHGVVGAPTPERVFLVLAGIGHDAATVLGTRAEFKKRLGWLSYVAAGARHLRARPLDVRASFDNAPARRLQTWTVLAANCGRLPGGIEVFPGATPDDGYLDTLTVPLRRTHQWAAVAAKGLTGHNRDVPALRYGRARTVWVVPDHPAPAQLDGDVVGVVADLRLRIQAGALIVRRP